VPTDDKAPKPGVAMDIESLAISEVKRLPTRKFRDSRGYFSETCGKDIFTASGLSEDFIQDYQSYSAHSVAKGPRSVTPLRSARPCQLLGVTDSPVMHLPIMETLYHQGLGTVR
jgi:hypothetical protein